MSARGHAVTTEEDEEVLCSLSVKSGARVFEITIGVDPVNGGWWLSCPPSLGWLAKLVGETEKDEHRALLIAIVESLKVHPSVTSVRWYRKSEFAEKMDRQPYYDSPTAASPVRGRVPPRNAGEAFHDISEAYVRAMPWLWFGTMGFAIVALGSGVEEIFGIDGRRIVGVAIMTIIGTWLGLGCVAAAWKAGQSARTRRTRGDRGCGASPSP